MRQLFDGGHGVVVGGGVPDPKIPGSNPGGGMFFYKNEKMQTCENFAGLAPELRRCMCFVCLWALVCAILVAGACFSKNDFLCQIFARLK